MNTFDKLTKGLFFGLDMLGCSYEIEDMVDSVDNFYLELSVDLNGSKRKLVIEDITEDVEENDDSGLQIWDDLAGLESFVIELADRVNTLENPWKFDPQTPGDIWDILLPEVAEKEPKEDTKTDLEKKLEEEVSSLKRRIQGLENQNKPIGGVTIPNSSYKEVLEALHKPKSTVASTPTETKEASVCDCDECSCNSDKPLNGAQMRTVRFHKRY